MYNTEIRGPLILGNKSLNQITTDITAPLYERPKFWWIVGLGISSILMLFGAWAIYVTDRYLGGKQHRWMGMGHHQFCMVDRYRSCRNCLFHIPSDPATGVAIVHQPCS